MTGSTPTEAPAGRAQPSPGLLDTIVTGLFTVGLSLQAALDSPPGIARQRVSEAAQRLDEIIREIRDAAFAAGGQGFPLPGAPTAGPDDLAEWSRRR
jgi:TctA family transporter